MKPRICDETYYPFKSSKVIPRFVVYYTRRDGQAGEQEFGKHEHAAAFVSRLAAGQAKRDKAAAEGRPLGVLEQNRAHFRRMFGAGVTVNGMAL